MSTFYPAKKKNTHKNTKKGLNNVFVVNSSIPKYNGPISTTLEVNIAENFCKEQGLIFYIESSYSNKFKFISGICVDWMSSYKNESEVLLMDQYLPR